MKNENVSSNTFKELDREGMDEMALTAVKHNESETVFDESVMAESMHGTVEEIFFASESILDPFWVSPLGGKFTEQIRELYFKREIAEGESVDFASFFVSRRPSHIESVDESRLDKEESGLLLNDAPNADEVPIYKIHSKGHSVLLSRYSKGKQAVRSSYASKEMLYKILCLMKRPLIIDFPNLSRLQLSAILKELQSIDNHIAIEELRKNERKVIVAKYKE